MVTKVKGSVSTDRYFNTLAVAVSKAGSLTVDDVVTLKERTSGNGGGFTGDVIADAGGAAATAEGGFSLMYLGSDLSLQLRYESIIDPTVFGLLSDANGSVGIGTDGGDQINAAITAGTYTTIPSGDYRISTAIALNKAATLNLEKGCTLWIDEGVHGIDLSVNDASITGDGKIKYLKSVSTSFDADSIAINIGNPDLTTYVRTISVRGINSIEIRGATESIRWNTVYWIELKNIDTWEDEIAVSANQQMSDPNKPTTTLSMNRIYNHGGAGSKVAGTQAYLMRYITDFNIQDCVTEWYPDLGIILTSQSGVMIKHYFEYCDSGLDLQGGSGNISIIDSYANGIVSGSYAFKALYGTVTVIGGRGVIESGGTYTAKGTEGKIIYIKPPFVSGGGTIGLDYTADTVISEGVLQAPANVLSENELIIPIDYSFVSTTSKTMTITVTHDSNTSWHPMIIKARCSVVLNAGTGLDLQECLRPLRKLDSSLVLGTQENYTTTTALVTLSASHTSSTVTVFTVLIDPSSADWSAAGEVIINLSRNSFESYAVT
jgi:hypothetical protein